MNISSMTGFARENGVFECSGKTLSYTFEIKSVNAKGLDVKMRLPQGFDDLEFDLKNLLMQYFTRGTFNMWLNFDNKTDADEITIETDLLEKLKDETAGIYLSNPDVFAKPSPAELLSIPGVISKTEQQLDETARNALYQNLSSTFEQALKKLQTSRLTEGQKLSQALNKLLDNMAQNRDQSEQIALSIEPAIKAKILEQIKTFSDGVDITPERFEQEVLFYMMRADVKEELDRLNAHILSAREILSKGGIIGRKLDFLCQELNREANTLCSKSMDLALTKNGMELKTLIEQFREQIQNVE
ncbi:MAG: YicC family protein [Alphaproteobacteria bacterium]|nr:YicC family protein [Alphaproteobacteria bacterium]